ncbi:hypothetical protein [Acinetobacter sp. HY1485]|uniref:hypothetical protein n=1 Tax=Acinetobacter sp. HY1485 TaxID=2970918 RepID=UPI0022B9A8EF|nr:hypothetical protein [Acinetobacter sp. HY1485]
MKNKVFALCVGLGLGLTGVAHAAPSEGPAWYSPTTIVQKCKGKTDGTPVSYAAHGVLWNGTCQTQFVPTKAMSLHGDEPELNSICKSDPTATSVTVNGQAYKGKCAVAFAPPRPQA